MKKLEFCKTEIECKNIFDEVFFKVVPEEKLINERFNLLKQLSNFIQFIIG